MVCKKLNVNSKMLDVKFNHFKNVKITFLTFSHFTSYKLHFTALQAMLKQMKIGFIGIDLIFELSYGSFFVDHQ